MGTIFSAALLLGALGVVLVSISLGLSLYAREQIQDRYRRQTLQRVHAFLVGALISWTGATVLAASGAATSASSETLARADAVRARAELEGLRVVSARAMAEVARQETSRAAAAPARPQSAQVDTGTDGTPLVVRERPEGAILSRLANGSEVTLAGDEFRAGDRVWVRVSYGDLAGWVARENLRYRN